ncbi:hypothetical protein JCM33374_g3990 [Metschnikowia sp. JCM 33374]|nr:hypothetical protein JCM33374_g3990 [Metschnikowia sp. JCM 33374]
MTAQQLARLILARPGIFPGVDPRDETLVLMRLTKNSGSTTTEAQDEDEQRNKTRRDSEKNTSDVGVYVSKTPDSTVAFRELATKTDIRGKRPQ